MHVTTVTLQIVTRRELTRTERALVRARVVNAANERVNLAGAGDDGYFIATKAAARIAAELDAREGACLGCGSIPTAGACYCTAEVAK